MGELGIHLSQNYLLTIPLLVISDVTSETVSCICVYEHVTVVNSILL